MGIVSTLVWGVLGLIGLALVSLLGVVVLALTVPFSLRATLGERGVGSPEVSVGWLFGLVRVEMALGRHARRWRLRVGGRVLLDRPLPAKEEEPASEGERTRGVLSWGRRAIGWLGKTDETRAPGDSALTRRSLADRLRDLSPAFLAVIWRGVRRIVASLRLRMGGHVRLGTADPAETGMLVGLLWALKGAGQLATLSFDADFEGFCFAGNAWASGEVHIGAIVWYVLVVLLARPVRRFWMAEVKARLATGRLGRLGDRMRPQARRVAVE